MAKRKSSTAASEASPPNDAKVLVSALSKDARALRSGAALRKACLDLLNVKAFDQITIREICDAAELHYATFFRHFETKEALLNSIAVQEIAQINELTLGIREANDYRSGFVALCTYVDEHRELWSTLLNGGAAGSMREEWVRQSQIVAAREAPINSWLPADLGTVCAATLIAETMAWWVSQPKDAFDVEHVVDILMRMLATSIIAPD